ncbi:unnamed protein product [Closterium sp. NIES-54]
MGWSGASLLCPTSNHRCAPTLLSSSSSFSSSVSSSNGVTPGYFGTPIVHDNTNTLQRSCSRLAAAPPLAPPCANRSLALHPHHPHRSRHCHSHTLPVLSTPVALSCLPPAAFARASPFLAHSRARSGSVRIAARYSSRPRSDSSSGSARGGIISSSNISSSSTRCNATKRAPANVESEEGDAGETAAAHATVNGKGEEGNKTARGLTAVVLAAVLLLAPPLPTPVLHWRLDDSQQSQLSQQSQVEQPLGQARQAQEVEWEAQVQQWRRAGLGVGVEVRWDDGAAHAFLLEKIKTLERSLESLVTSIKNGKVLDKFITVWTGPLVTSDVVDAQVKAVLDAEKRETGFNMERIGEYVFDAAAEVASRLSRFTLAAEGEVPVAAATGIVEGTFDKDFPQHVMLSPSDALTCSLKYSLTDYSLTDYSLTDYSLTDYSLTDYSLTDYSLTDYSLTCLGQTIPYPAISFLQLLAVLPTHHLAPPLSPYIRLNRRPSASLCVAAVTSPFAAAAAAAAGAAAVDADPHAAAFDDSDLDSYHGSSAPVCSCGGVRATRQMQGRNLFPWGGGGASADGSSSSRSGGGRGGGWESEEEEEVRQQRALRVRRELRRIELKAELRDELAALGERALRPGMPPSSTTAAERKEVEDLLLQLCQLGPPIGYLTGGAAEGGDWEGGGVQEWGESEGWDGDGGGGGAPLTHGSWVLIYASCDPEPPPSTDPPPLPAIPLSPMQLLLRAAELPGVEIARLTQQIGSDSSGFLTGAGGGGGGAGGSGDGRGGRESEGDGSGGGDALSGGGGGVGAGDSSDVISKECVDLKLGALGKFRLGFSSSSSSSSTSSFFSNSPDSQQQQAASQQQQGQLAGLLTSFSSLSLQPLEVWGNTIPSADLPLLTLTLPVPQAIQRAVAARAATAAGGEWVTCYVDDDLRVDCNEEGLFLAFARANE